MHPWERPPSTTDRLQDRPYAADNPALWDDSTDTCAARRAAAIAEVVPLSARRHRPRKEKL